MALNTGTRLGPYEILSGIGAGGMGEVYKATDTRLDRTVAIKVLPERVASDPDLKQRFEREAKTVAALNHPHICTLHDIGSQDGVDFLVMEYLDGETLAQRLEKGALPLDQALQIAIELADALDKAHRQGIVHRDLKPGNIMLTSSRTKLLDFGLAKLKPAGEGAAGLTALPTQSAGLTAQGANPRDAAIHGAGAVGRQGGRRATLGPYAVTAKIGEGGRGVSSAGYQAGLGRGVQGRAASRRIVTAEIQFFRLPWVSPITAPVAPCSIRCHGTSMSAAPTPTPNMPTNSTLSGNTMIIPTNAPKRKPSIAGAPPS